MSEEGKDLKFLCFDIYFFPLVVDCIESGLETWGYVLPLCPPHANTLKMCRVSWGTQPLWYLSPFHLLFQAVWFLRMSKQVWTE